MYVIRGSPAKCSSTASRIHTFLAVGLCVTIFCLHNLIWFSGNPVIVMADICKQPTSPTLIPSNLSRFTAAPGFAQEAAERLAGAVKIPTMLDNISLFINAYLIALWVGPLTTWALSTKMNAGLRLKICMSIFAMHFLRCSFP
jgi:hypothetical protein